MARAVFRETAEHRLYLSPKTVRNYVSSIFTKLQVSDRSQAIVHAREAGWEREEILRDSDHDQRFLASRYLVAYTASKPLRASGASVHRGYPVLSKDSRLPHYRTAAGGL
jgi:hypothetical protein